MTGDAGLEKARDVHARHKGRLLSLPGVTGTGIGAGKRPGNYVIVVYLESQPRSTPGPTAIEGVRVEYTVTGGIRPQ